MSRKKKVKEEVVPEPEPKIAVLSEGEKAEMNAALQAVTAINGGKYRLYLDDGTGDWVTVETIPKPVDIRAIGLGDFAGIVIVKSG